MTGTEIYKRTPAYERQSREIRLLAPHWKLLLAFDGVRSLSDAAVNSDTTFADAVPLTQKFLKEGWIEEQPITLDQYMKRIGAKDISSAGATVAPPVVVHEPSKEKEKPAAATPAPAASAPAPTTAATPAPPPLPTTTPATVIAPPKTTPLPALSKSPRGAMKLSAVVDFITSLVGNVSLGQLLVYRVFLRVPPDLLLAEDVASVNLVNDTSMIRSEKLQKAIADAVNAVAKRALPDSVFAPA